jgi:hypothetical protein
MGYTHYWKMDKDLEVTLDQKILMGYVLEDHKDLIDQTDGPDFQTEDHLVFLNGIGEDAHETFAVSRRTTEFEFTKTARKPYDIVVTKMLLILSLSDGFTFSSDGIWEDKEDESDHPQYKRDEEWNEAIEWMNERGFDAEKLLVENHS